MGYLGPLSFKTLIRPCDIIIYIMATLGKTDQFYQGGIPYPWVIPPPVLSKD